MSPLYPALLLLKAYVAFHSSYVQSYQNVTCDSVIRNHIVIDLLAWVSMYKHRYYEHVMTASQYTITDTSSQLHNFITLRL
jgi:hypothetical protein